MFDNVKEIADPNQHVIKHVYTKNNAVAESVLYEYEGYQNRTVICCSTQSGCPMGCRFCGAGDNFVRSLTTEEILYQIEYSVKRTQTEPSKIKRLQIMFMSMGEPMLNMKNLIPALHHLNQWYPKAALLVSTSAPRVEYEPFFAASERYRNVGLQFSVHESEQHKRNQLIPFEKKLTLKEMAYLGRRWFAKTGRKPFFNYCAHDANSSDEDATRLMELFDPVVFNATVSVVCERTEGLQATNEHQRGLAVQFGDKLLQKGFDVRVFDPAGQDTIGGGCGQLWFVKKWMDENPDHIKPSVGNGKPVVHAPRLDQ